MRVLHVYNKHRGGGGANIATQASIDLLRGAGLQVEVLARSGNDLPAGLRGRMQAGIGVVWGRESVRDFGRLIDGFKPDLVHAHELYPLVSPWIVPECARRGVPVVMSCVDFRLTCPNMTHWRAGALCTRCLGGREYHAVLNNCRGSMAESTMSAFYTAQVRRQGLYRHHVTRFIAASDFARRWLVEHAGIDSRSIETIAPPVCVPLTAAPAGVGSYVAYAGRFVPEKGLDVFAAAATATGLPFRMSRNVASQATMTPPPGPEVVLTSNLADLTDFYRGARLLVVPSHWFETFGLVGAEAMSHGLPVIGSRLGAIEELIDDGVNGLLFEPGNAADLADKVQRLWQDPALCQRLGQAARAKATLLWRPDRHLARLLALYDGVLATAAASSKSA